MKIVPAILAQNIDDFHLRLKEAESFTDYIQLDIMDGVFVPTKSFPPEEINTINSPLSFEAHLMVKDPLDFLSRINNPGLMKVLYHFEADADHIKFIKYIKERKLNAGMAIKPEIGFLKAFKNNIKKGKIDYDKILLKK